MKAVRIADLKARLSEHLRAVRRGHPIVVLDRQTPIARIVPYVSEEQALRVRSPIVENPSLQAVVLPPAVDLPMDVVTVLLEERQAER